MIGKTSNLAEIQTLAEINKANLNVAYLYLNIYNFWLTTDPTWKLVDAFEENVEIERPFKEL